jgi:L-amino acid N-acyltransferase YncA
VVGEDVGAPFANDGCAPIAVHGEPALLPPREAAVWHQHHVLPPLEIRSVQAADLQPLFEMYAAVVEDGGALPANGASMEVFLEGWIRNRSVFVAWTGDDIVGSYFVRSNFPAFAAHIALGGYTVSRRARRRGIGWLMVEDSLQQAARLGYTAMMFNLVLEQNPSRSLYESLGFEVIGQIPEAKGEEVGMIYWRSLADIIGHVALDEP